MGARVGVGGVTLGFRKTRQMDWCSQCQMPIFVRASLNIFQCSRGKSLQHSGLDVRDL